MLRRSATSTACAALLFLTGCASDPAPADPAVAVTLRFENVRRDPALDEWELIQGVLAKHSARPVAAQPSPARRMGALEVRTYTAQVMLPDFARLDAIRRDLDALAGPGGTNSTDDGFFASIGRAFSGEPRPAERPAGERLELALAGAEVRYLSNFVGASLSVAVSGITAEGHGVLLYAEPGGEPVTARAGRGGLWSARLRAVPADGWIYGVSQDPAGRVRPRYFRVSAATMKQEMLSREQFERARPSAAEAPAVTDAPTAARAPSDRRAEPPADEQTRPARRPQGTWADG